jgi:hypothetical protein
MPSRFLSALLPSSFLPCQPSFLPPSFLVNLPSLLPSLITFFPS